MRWDFYSGFEGEPELLIEHLKADETLRSIRVWEGYFSRVVERLSPGPGGWTGIALQHHLDTGWNDESPWEDRDPAGTLQQLEDAPDSAPGPEYEFREAYTSLLRAAIREGGRVLIGRS